MDRRDLIKLGIGGLAGAVATQELFASQGTSQNATGETARTTPGEQTAQFDFQIRPGVTSRINAGTNQVLSSSTWAVPSQFEGYVPALLSTAAPTLAELESWPDSAGAGRVKKGARPSEGLRNFDSLMKTSLSGGIDMSDVAGEAALAVVERRRLNLALTFSHPGPYEYSPEYNVYSSSGLPVIEEAGGPLSLRIGKTSPGDVALAASAPPSIDLLGWKFQFRPPHVHSLGSCVSQPVNHFHLEVFRARGGGRYDYVIELHLGTYRSGSQRCFVLWNNTTPKICWKTCNPTRNDLVQMFKWVLTAAAGVAGVAIASWIVAAIAEAAGAAVFIPLLLLA